MASNTSYAYQKPSTVATRSLVAGTKPTETASAGSHDSDVPGRPTLQRNTTDHYQQAVSAANSKAEDTERSAASKPGFERQQSWKHTDMKRGAMEKILGGRPGAQGYTTTST